MIQALGLSFLPLTVALCALLFKDLKRVRWIAAVGGVGQITSTLCVAIPVLLGHVRPSFLTWFLLDGVAAWIVCVNSIVYGGAMVTAALLIEPPEDLHLTPKGARALFGLGSLFIISANAVVCASDLGALWIAMEATTLITAPLVLVKGTRKSIEAAWKYLILCGVGIAFALLGTVLLLVSAGDAVPPGGGLGIAWLTQNASLLKRPLLDTSFVFLILGYGTKAGLFPVHNWLPDAHSESPSPASALLSGALLNCAMVALWRISGIIEVSHAHKALMGVLAPMGAVSVLAAAIMLVRQRDLKRMWAYSSIENMGLLAVAIGLRSAPIFALHALAHSMAKGAAFLLSGKVIKLYGTVNLSKLTGIMHRSPGLGFALLAAGAAVMGAPPFGSFVSEWLMLAKITDTGHWGILLSLAIGLAISFVAVLVHLGKVVFGEKSANSEVDTAPLHILPAVLMLITSAAMFVAVTPAVMTFLTNALKAGSAR